MKSVGHCRGAPFGLSGCKGPSLALWLLAWDFIDYEQSFLSMLVFHIIPALWHSCGVGWQPHPADTPHPFGEWVWKKAWTTLMPLLSCSCQSFELQLLAYPPSGHPHLPSHLLPGLWQVYYLAIPLTPVVAAASAFLLQCWVHIAAFLTPQCYSCHPSFH